MRDNSALLRLLAEEGKYAMARHGFEAAAANSNNKQAYAGSYHHHLVFI